MSSYFNNSYLGNSSGEGVAPSPYSPTAASGGYHDPMDSGGRMYPGNSIGEFPNYPQYDRLDNYKPVGSTPGAGATHSAGYYGNHVSYTHNGSLSGGSGGGVGSAPPISPPPPAHTGPVAASQTGRSMGIPGGVGSHPSSASAPNDYLSRYHHAHQSPEARGMSEPPTTIKSEQNNNSNPGPGVLVGGRRLSHGSPGDASCSSSPSTMGAGSDTPCQAATTPTSTGTPLPGNHASNPKPELNGEDRLTDEDKSGDLSQHQISPSSDKQEPPMFGWMKSQFGESTQIPPPPLSLQNDTFNQC